MLTAISSASIQDCLRKSAPRHRPLLFQQGAEAHVTLLAVDTVGVIRPLGMCLGSGSLFQEIHQPSSVFNLLRVAPIEASPDEANYFASAVFASAFAVDADIANSTTSGCSTACTRIYQSVCGSDGVTYPNDCVLKVAQSESGGMITLVSDGKCPTPSSSAVGPSASSNNGDAGCPGACIDIYDPVTDENGVQYSSECYLRMAKCSG